LCTDYGGEASSRHCGKHGTRSSCNISRKAITASLMSPLSGPLAYAFDEFFVWGLYLRGAADTLAFIALVWALAAAVKSLGWPGEKGWFR